MDYYSKTYHHKNPIKRVAHQSRVSRAISLLNGIEPSSRVIDFGCGKGFFIEQLRAAVECEAVGYDKYMESESQYVFNDFELVDRKGTYDFFTCFETLEHCHGDEQDRIIDLAWSQLKPDGKFIISVPIEIGPVSLLKNFMRRKTKDATFPDFTLKNIIKAVFLKPTTFHRDTLEYPGHFGFDHRVLEKKLRQHAGFSMTKRSYSPLPFIPTFMINSQVFFVLSKR